MLQTRGVLKSMKAVIDICTVHISHWQWSTLPLFYEAKHTDAPTKSTAAKSSNLDLSCFWILLWNSVLGHENIWFGFYSYKRDFE